MGLSQITHVTLPGLGGDGSTAWPAVSRVNKKKDSWRGSKMIKISQYDEGRALHHPSSNTIYQGLNKTQYSSYKQKYLLKKKFVISGVSSIQPNVVANI